MEEFNRISGIVIKGDQRGRKLGFPTANIALTQEIPEGIYAAIVTVNGKEHHAASFVGSAKTFEKTEVSLESFLFDFDEDIYGKEIIVRLYKKIRDNKKFGSAEELVEQMKKDVIAIKGFFAN